MVDRIKRREFLKAAAGAAALTTASPESLTALVRPPQEVRAPLVPLGNGESPALQFQAYPGGTGALMEKLWKSAASNPFERTPIRVAPWEGTLSSDENDVAFLPVHRLAALLREGSVSSTELTQLYLGRLKRLDPILLCAVTILEDRALEEAAKADREIGAGAWKGPLHGIPYGIKDLFSVSGSPTTWGSADFENRVIEEDAEIVVRLRDAGAVLIAKLSTGEFARGDRWYRGQTKNPWNVEEGSSGSSAGPASATAAGCVAFAIGTETQGSIVSPARRCGLSALRPTFGRISRHGGMVLSWSMDKVGPICRSAEDCAIVFNALHGSDEKDPATLTAPFNYDREADIRSLRIGFTEDAPEGFVQALRGLGATVLPMPEIPQGRSHALSVESASAFDFHIAKDGDPGPLPQGLSETELRRQGRFRTGREIGGMDYVHSQRRRMLLMNEMAEAMKGFDMFVSGSGQVGLTNQTGHPAVVVPYDFGVRDPESETLTEMPLTTTLIGDLFADDKILNVAHAFQRRTDWHLRRPAVG